MFYPDDPSALADEVNLYIQGGEPSPGMPLRAVIAPHAGYPYSGPIAGSAYRAARDCGVAYTSAILLGPAHRLYFRGIARSGAGAFDTPLGEFPVDAESEAALDDLPFVTVLPEAHREEHGIEVHLPFLFAVRGTIPIVPLVVGDVGGREVAQAIEALSPGPETLVIVSSDLSHYLSYTRAREMDQSTCEAIVEGRPQTITPTHACGCMPIRGLMESKNLGECRRSCIDLRNSGDTAGDRGRVVGYGAFLFT